MRRATRCLKKRILVCSCLLQKKEPRTLPNICICVYMYICIYIYTYICMYKYIYIYIHLHVYHTYICTYIYKLCIYIYTYIYTMTYMCIKLFSSICTQKLLYMIRVHIYNQLCSKWESWHVNLIF